jgi:hypothetical protein
LSNPELLMMKGLISELSTEDQGRCKECYDKITALLEEYDAPGFMALALIGIERSE